MRINVFFTKFCIFPNLELILLPIFYSSKTKTIFKSHLYYHQRLIFLSKLVMTNFMTQRPPMILLFVLVKNMEIYALKGLYLKKKNIKQCPNNERTTVIITTNLILKISHTICKTCRPKNRLNEIHKMTKDDCKF